MSTERQSAENGLPEHPHLTAVHAYLDNAGVTVETLRYAATHEALCRSWIFDLLMGLADTMEAEDRVTPPAMTGTTPTPAAPSHRAEVNREGA